MCVCVCVGGCVCVCVCVGVWVGGCVREVSANKQKLEAIKTPTNNTNSHTEHSNTLILACITVFTDTHVQHRFVRLCVYCTHCMHKATLNYTYRCMYILCTAKQTSWL